MPEYHLLRDIIRPYMVAGKAWKKPGTQKTNAQDVRPLERFFKHHWITHAAADVRRHRQVVTGKVVADYRERRKIEGVGVTTIARELSLACSACKYAISELNLDIPNPFLGRMMTRADARTVKPRSRVLKEGEERALLIASPQPLRDMILLFLETGLRVTELRRLRHDQLDLDVGVVAFEPDEHKSGNHAASALTPEAVEIIRRQPTLEGSPYVFHVDGEEVLDSWLRHNFDRARKAAGCPDLQMRDLRRTALTRWRFRFGIDVAQAQARHADKKTTERVYARPSVEIALEALRSTKQS